MKNHCLFVFLLVLHFSAFGQIKGVVKDSVSGKPVSFVAISVENENIGTTSEENGEFEITVSPKSKNLVFNALGFEKKTVRISNASEVRLKPIAFPIDEIVISKRLETRQKEIGRPENQISEAFDNGPKIDTKFFPYSTSYKKTKFIKQVVMATDSKIDDATFKIHFYSVDANGEPGNELIEKDFMVSVGKGVKETRFNVTKFNLKMPQQGLFVGYEKLMLARNKVEKTAIDPNTKTTQTQTSYAPLMLYNSVKSDFQITFSGGKWIRKEAKNPDGSAEKMTIYEPAINLILTN